MGAPLTDSQYWISLQSILGDKASAAAAAVRLRAWTKGHKVDFSGGEMKFYNGKKHTREKRGGNRSQFKHKDTTPHCKEFAM